MSYGPELLLVAAVATVGVLHTIVPDHWVPITLIARQRGWSKSETARAALQAGTGHVLSTLLIALVVWLAGVAFAERFGHVVDTVSSLALIAFGGWFAISAWRDVRMHGGHGHSHSHDFRHLHGDDHGARPSSVHGPELQRIATEEGVLELSIFETGLPPRFRLSGVTADTVTVQTCREGDEHQDFRFANRGTYWESVEQIPEPHQFAVSVIINHGGHAHRYETHFTEHDHEHGELYGHGHGHETEPEDDPLYAPLRGETALLTRHVHAHRHGRGSVHTHWHDHTSASSHSITAEIETAPPAHDHRHRTTARTTLLLILGSSPMVEGIPAFFAAGKYGIGLIVVMAVVFAISTIATYVLFCVYSTAGLQRVRLGAFERYGEVLSGAFIALVGLAFWIWPVL
jgi:ABC-type nickel/cobalt efflux system permease component RcnA